MLEHHEKTGGAPGCNRCRDLEPLNFDFSFAYQPIVDFQNRRIFGHEALVRGVKGEAAASILARVNDDNRYRFEEYRRFGFKTAIDDFGAGYAGLNLLADFQPDIVKIDMDLVRNINDSNAKQAIVEGIVHMCRKLDIKVLAEGIETTAERDFLARSGVDYFQGYLFCKPAFQAIGRIPDCAYS